MQTFGCGSELNLSSERWRVFIRQAWLKGFLNRQLVVGSGHNMMNDIVFASYTVADEGIALLKNVEIQEVLLPAVDKKLVQTTDTDSTPSSSQKVTHQRKGKGSHALSIAQELLSDKSNWFEIKSSDDYNFLGVFTTPFPQRLGYCEDISKLPNYEVSDPHFLYSDIQIGKGKARPKRLIQMNIDGKSENVYYRFAPCGGVKRCAVEGCLYVVCTNEVKPCSQHSESKLVHSGECPVEFFYIWPENVEDKRRWLTGLVRAGSMEDDDLHNHPHHKERKIPVKIDTDIRRAMIDNPHLKTSDVMTGKVSVECWFNYSCFISVRQGNGIHTRFSKFSCSKQIENKEHSIENNTGQ